jgi:hypothetical protein
LKPNADKKVPCQIGGQMQLASNSGLARSASALIALTKAAEQPSEKQRHEGGDVWASSDGHMDVMVNGMVRRIDRLTNGGSIF